MRTKLIAGNWKMNGSKDSVRSLLEKIKIGFSEINNSSLQLVVFPPFVFLNETQFMLENTGILHGAQDVSQFANGAFTGEISLSMLHEFGCRYALIGHYERRNLFGETDAIVAAKFIAAQKTEIIPILCVGETLNERNAGITNEIIARQIQAVLNSGAKLNNFIISYEPVWAIGTGQHATPNQAQEAHKFIRDMFAKIDPNVAEKLQILYGGSLKPDNAKELFAMPDIDGGLVGVASLKAEDFLNIGRAAICNH